MAEFMEVLQSRRSIRKYEDKDVSDELLEQVLEAVKWSPSWANTQCWEVVAIRSQESKDKLQKILSPRNPATRAVSSAPVLLAIIGKLEASGYYSGQVTTKFGDWMMYDLGLATQSLCLAAHDLGLGTVIVGLFDHDKAKEILSVPAGYEVVTLVPLGYPAKVPPAPKRRQPNEFTHKEKWGIAD